MVYACRGSRPLRMTGDMFFGTIKNGRGRAPTLQYNHKIFENLFDFAGHDDLGVPFYRKPQLPCHSEQGAGIYLFVIPSLSRNLLEIFSKDPSTSPNGFAQDDELQAFRVIDCYWWF